MLRQSGLSLLYLPVLKLSCLEAYNQEVDCLPRGLSASQSGWTADKMYAELVKKGFEDTSNCLFCIRLQSGEVFGERRHFHRCEL